MMTLRSATSSAAGSEGLRGPALSVSRLRLSTNKPSMPKKSIHESRPGVGRRYPCRRNMRSRSIPTSASARVQPTYAGWPAKMIHAGLPDRKSCLCPRESQRISPAGILVEGAYRCRDPLDAARAMRKDAVCSALSESGLRLKLVPTGKRAQEEWPGMTIVAGVKVRDGLVLATDSMTTVTVGTPNGPEFVNAYEHGRKLFQIPNLPIGAVTFGLGNIGERSMEGLVREACRQMPEEINGVEQVAEHLFEFIAAEYRGAFDGLAEEHKPICGFMVAGYAPGDSFARIFGFEFPVSMGVAEIGEPERFGAIWRGVSGPFVRLWRGFDPDLIAGFVGEAGISEERFKELISPFETQVAYDGMPVQDAVSFATYILDTTIGFSRFAHGMRACGGPLQVAAILPDDGFGFHWIAKPELHIPPRP